MDKRIFMVRHGQTTSNVARALDTALPGADLTDLGIQQAQEAGRELSTHTPRLYVASSEAARAQQTAQHLADSFRAAGGEANERGTVAHIQEIPAGELEMSTDDNSHSEYHVTFGAWLMGDLHRPVRGALNGQEVLERYLPQFLDFLAGVPNEWDAAVVSHGAVIRFIAAFIGGIDADFAFSNYLANTRWVELVADSSEQLQDLRDQALSGDVMGLKGALTVVEWAGVRP